MFCFSSLGTEINSTNLPPASTNRIEFSRDIQPILQQSCLKCHGPEKPKSRFRLDNRESALKGGANGVAIVPGDSAASPLIHFVAGLVEDMQMPPPDQGEPLSAEQIGLLRAWIDQGANWSETISSPELTFTLAPELRWIGVEGDQQKFREIEGVREGWSAGIQEFSSIQHVGDDETFSIDGRVLPHDQDFKIRLSLDKKDFGFVRGGFESWRKYYDDTGGFAPFAPTNSFDLNRNLYLDIGRVWFDAGLTLPDFPQIVVGYEYQFRNGNKSTLEWGQIGADDDAKHILPALKHVDEETHIIKLDVTHEFRGWQIQDSARVEFYQLGTERQNGPISFSGPPPDAVVNVSERQHHVQGMNTFTVGRQIKPWLFASGGYLYSRLEGDAAFNQSTVSPVGAPVPGDQWFANNILLKRESQIVSLYSLWGPWSGLSLAVGVQGEWTRQESFGNQDLRNIDAGGDTNNFPTPALGKLDSFSARENAMLRFTAIPYTVVFAETRFRQEELSRLEEGRIAIDFPPPDTFTRDTEADIDSQEFRVGFDTSPLRSVTFGASARHAEKHTDYDNVTSHAIPELQPGYPGFLLWRDIEEDQAQARISWRATSWLKTSFTYRFQETDFDNATPPIPSLGIIGGSLHTARQRANVYSANITLTPWRRLFVSTTFSYTDSRLMTALDGVGPLVPYDGDVYSILSSATYSLNAKTDLRFNCAYSRSAYGQNNAASGLAAGIDFERVALQAGVARRLTKNLATSLLYGFSQYREPTSGGQNNFTAHAVFATFAVSWP